MHMSCVECGQTLPNDKPSRPNKREVPLECWACAFNACYADICDRCFYGHAMLHLFSNWPVLRDTGGYSEGITKRVEQVKDWLEHGPTQETGTTDTGEREGECGLDAHSPRPGTQDRSASGITTQVQQAQEGTKATKA
jgi:hypothetical protein